MSGRLEVRSKVVCWETQPGAGAKTLPGLDRDLHGVEMVAITDAEDVRRELGKPGEAVLLLVTRLTPKAAELVKELRGEESWSALPVFVAVSGESIDKPLQERANALQIELLPLPMPSGRLWSHLREAGSKFRAKLYRTRLNRRRHFRMPLSVTAYCPIEIRTVDISIAGIQFLTNHPYCSGDLGFIDIPSLREIVGGNMRFAVVTNERMARGEFQYRIRAQFVDLDPESIKRLGKALSVLETSAYRSGEIER